MIVIMYARSASVLPGPRNKCVKGYSAAVEWQTSNSRPLCLFILPPLSTAVNCSSVRDHDTSNDHIHVLVPMYNII